MFNGLLALMFIMAELVLLLGLFTQGLIPYWAYSYMGLLVLGLFAFNLLILAALFKR